MRVHAGQSAARASVHQLQRGERIWLNGSAVLIAAITSAPPRASCRRSRRPAAGENAKGGTYVGSVSLAEHGPDDPHRMETLLELGGEQRFGSEEEALVFVEQAARDYVDRLLGGIDGGTPNLTAERDTAARSTGSPAAGWTAVRRARVP